MSKDKSSANPAGPEIQGQHEDDVIVVPRGSNRSRFLMTALLAVLVLTTFTVSGEVVDVLSCQQRPTRAYLSWKLPDGTVEEMSPQDFVLQKQAITKATSLVSGGRQRDQDDSATAQHLLTDRLAQEAGVAVTNEEMSKIILQVFGTADSYKRRLADFRMSAKDFEKTLRSILRVRRYQVLIAQGFAQPDPDAVLKAWREAHQEYSIETIEIPAEGFAAEAEAAAPDAAGLEAWYNGISEVEKNYYRRPIEPKTAAEFVWFNINPDFTNAERLLQKYPRPATENADEIARNWYDSNKELLYLKPDLAADKPREPDDFKPFEEVAEHARTAGIAYQSLLDWFNDVRFREEGGNPVSLYDEGTGMGLAYRLEATPKTIPEWDAAGMPFKGKGPILATFEPTSQVQKLLPEVLIDANGIFIGRLIGKEASRLPEFPEFQDKVREAWLKMTKFEFAKAKLESFVSKFPEETDPNTPTLKIHMEPDGEKFHAAAKEAGLEVKTQDWFDASVVPDPSDTAPFRRFVRSTALRYGKTLGTISPPTNSSDSTAAWVSRVAGKRDPDPAGLSPLDYESARSLAAYDARESFLKSTFYSEDFMKQQYALDLESWRRVEDEGAPK
ncbi:MAG: hypothetical protein ACKVXR_08740 [Planctomycetota bacterium]